MRLFRLTAITLVQQKLCFLVLLLAWVLPFVLPKLGNIEVDPVLEAPTRALVAWQVCWVSLFTWLLYVAAQQGAKHVSSSMGAYFSSRGLSPGRQLLELWLPPFVMLCVLALSAFLVTTIFAQPGQDYEARQWVVMSIQQMSLYLIVGASLLLLTIGIASRFGATLGFVVPACWLLYGLYGVGFLNPIVAAKDAPMTDAFYVVSPHYHLTNLTHRFVHKQGNLPVVDYMRYFSYHSGLAMILASLATISFTPHKK